MSHLIRTQRAMTSTPSPTTTPTTAATAPTELDHRLVNSIDLVGPSVPQVQASLTSLVALPVSARRTHRRPCTTDQMLPSGSITDASGTWPAKKNTWGPCQQLKTAKVTQVTNCRIPMGYNERHRATPMAEQHSALAHDIGHVIHTFCPMRWKSWKAMSEETNLSLGRRCWRTRNTFKIFVTLQTNYNLEDMDKDLFAYLNQLFSEHYKQWKSNLHQSIDVFADVYVRLWHELTESLHPSVPPEYISSVFLHHRPHNPSTSSKHNNQACRPPTLSPTSSKILRTTFL
ncbi:hypothetical protein D8674_013287 [Pyrus ussuriensis x Pyrus communis]|uniref:Uncharacterized protein n=1 Tax=Pyrus ussuriensis x Pyrus communis TaxID=2448454 RepID=A0A5N5GQ64_9ROSA|nr:hypothetical protein D8674_013287 [Pyrus ussuriensis x Pyrus communis]